MTVLKNIPDQTLETGLKNLVAKERELLHELILYIKEVDTRRLYLAKAYPSMYEYLTLELGYSGSAAIRRLDAARLLKAVPTMASDIKEGRLNLSQISEVARAIKEKERCEKLPINSEIKRSLVSAVVGKTMRETQKEIATLLNIEVPRFEKQRMHQDSSVRLEITLTEEQLVKLNRCKDLSAAVTHSEHKESSWAVLFEFLADQYLAKKDIMPKSVNQDNLVQILNNTPNTKQNSNKSMRPGSLSKTTRSAVDVLEETESKTPVLKTKDSPKNVLTKTISAQEITTASVVETSKSKVIHNPKKTTANNNLPKTITPKLRRDIIHRDKCCQFRDSKTQRICGATYGLEIDHKTSKWAGGSNTPENLQVLCRAHNIYKYRQENFLRWK